MLQESNAPNVTSDKSRSRQEEVPTETPDEDEAWKVMADCQISLPLTRLLKLVPRFTEKVTHIIVRNESEQVLVNFMNPGKGPTIMDKQSPTIKVIIHGQEVSGSIVNVINKVTSLIDWALPNGRHVHSGYIW